MRSKSNQVQILRKVFLAFVIISLGYNPIYSSNEQDEQDTEEIKWVESNWDRETRDKSFFYLPTAYIESSTLYIQNDKPDGAIDIAIVSGKSGVVVWEQVVSEAATALVVIPLEGLPSGSYSLQMVNEWGGYLCGSFRKK